MAVLLSLVLSCATPGRMTPVDPIPFDVEKSCPPLPVRHTMDDVAENLGTCAFEAIQNGDQNRDVAEYNRTAALHNSPDGLGARAKVFLQGLGWGAAGGALLGAYVAGKAALTPIAPWVWLLP